MLHNTHIRALDLGAKFTYGRLAIQKDMKLGMYVLSGASGVLTTQVSFSDMMTHILLYDAPVNLGWWNLSLKGLKAITVHQPWASYIESGAKRYETRSWRTGYRGLIAIHAGKTWNSNYDEFNKGIQRMFPSRTYQTLKFEQLIALCELKSCVPTESLNIQKKSFEAYTGDFSAGRYAWELDLLMPISFDVKGKQGIWMVAE